MSTENGRAWPLIARAVLSWAAGFLVIAPLTALAAIALRDAPGLGSIIETLFGDLDSLELVFFFAWMATTALSSLLVLVVWAALAAATPRRLADAPFAWSVAAAVVGAVAAFAAWALVTAGGGPEGFALVAPRVAAGVFVFSIPAAALFAWLTRRAGAGVRGR